MTESVEKSEAKNLVTWELQITLLVLIVLPFRIGKFLDCTLIVMVDVKMLCLWYIVIQGWAWVVFLVSLWCWPLLFSQGF